MKAVAESQEQAKSAVVNTKQQAEQSHGQVVDQSTTVPSYGFDMAQLPMLPPNQGHLQPKLRINAPNDRYEQEADRIADQVMRMKKVDGVQTDSPSSRIQQKPLVQQISRLPLQAQRTCNNCGTCSKCKEEEQIQRKAITQTPSIASPSFSSRIQSTRGNGLAMDANTNTFMSSRFGTDFSGIRIHTDTTAQQMSREINARAFTVGQDVYFNQGEYQPNTASGQRLLAHELVHVLQQNLSTIQRKMNYRKPRPVQKDPLSLILGGKKLGKTYASFNGNHLIDGSTINQMISLIARTLAPSKLTFSENNNTYTAVSDNNDIQSTVSAKMETITKPQNNVWTGTIPPLTLPSQLNRICGNRNSINVEMRGFSNLDQTVLTHEMEHWADIKKLAQSEIKPAHDIVLNLSGTGNSKESAQEDWKSKLSEKMLDIRAKIRNFLIKLIAANNVYDNPRTGTHHTKTSITPNRGCSKIEITPRNN